MGDLIMSFILCILCIMSINIALPLIPFGNNFLTYAIALTMLLSAIAYIRKLEKFGCSIVLSYEKCKKFDSRP